MDMKARTKMTRVKAALAALCVVAIASPEAQSVRCGEADLSCLLLDDVEFSENPRSRSIQLLTLENEAAAILERARKSGDSREVARAIAIYRRTYVEDPLSEVTAWCAARIRSLLSTRAN